jgi:hypothetical protein
MRNPSENTNRHLCLSDSELETVCGGDVRESRGFIGETVSNNRSDLGTSGCMRNGMIETTSNRGYCSVHEAY